MRMWFNTGVIATGLAMFSMFFGAGNTIYPLSIGQYAGAGNWYAIAGFFITAVIVPLLGLISVVLFEGDYKQFFYRIGKVPGFLVITAIIALIGPFGAMPRLITVSWASLTPYVPNLSLFTFSLITAPIIFLLTINKSTMLDVLGRILSPILFVSLVIIIVKGIFFSGGAMISSATTADLLFARGLWEGYNTMDLLATGFFAHIVISILRTSGNYGGRAAIAQHTFAASIVGATLLGIVYVGMSFVAAKHSVALNGVPQGQLMGAIAQLILGDYLGIIAAIAVIFACLTTVIALAAVFADFVCDELTSGFLSYASGLAATVAITALLANLDFSGLMFFLVPILKICYPAIIVLSLLNIAYKYWGFKPVKLPVLVVFIASLAPYVCWYVAKVCSWAVC